MAITQIEWTATRNPDGTYTPGYSFNPWWGCLKVSPGCQHCYADTLAHRYGFDIWGPAKTTNRRMMSENYWKQPHKWNKEAAAAGVRRRVFCASMADVFEYHPQVIEPRNRLFQLIRETPALDWLLLTKRPENIGEMLPESWLDMHMPRNIWLGTSVENQEQADKRIPELLKVPARVRFLSCEPLLEAVDLTLIPDALYDAGMPFPWQKLRGPQNDPRGIHWVIAGGESGHGARPMHPAWARGLRDQCNTAGVAFFMKQMGGAQHKGGNLEDMPADLRIREMPTAGL